MAVRFWGRRRPSCGPVFFSLQVRELEGHGFGEVPQIKQGAHASTRQVRARCGQPGPDFLFVLLVDKGRQHAGDDGAAVSGKFV